MDNDSIFNKKTYSVPAVWSILIYIVGFFIFAAIFSGVLSVVDIFIPGVLSSRLGNQVFMICSTLSTTYFTMRVVDVKPWSVLGLEWSGRWRDILLGFLVAFSVMFLGISICLLTKSIEITSIQWSANGLAFSFLIFVIVAFNEELMFRGYILRRLLDTNLNPYVSLLISSLLFAVMHSFNPNFGVLPFLNLVLAGAMLGVSYIYTRNLWYPMALHLFWNWLQGPVFGFEVSGMNSYNSLITQVRPVNNLLNGGAFGFEGSLLCTFLMLVVIAVIGYYFKNKREALVD